MANNVERAETEIILSGGQKAGKTINELTAQSVKLYREIKKMEEGSEEFVEATAQYQKINGRLKEVRNQVNGVSKAQSELNSKMNEYIPFNSHLQKFISTGKAITASIKGQTVAQKALNIVTKAFPLALILGLLASLVNYLTTTQAGMDKLRQVTLPVVQVFERFKGLIQEIGGRVFETFANAFKNPMQAIKDFGQAILDNIINRFTAVAKFGPAIMKLFSKDWKEGLKDLGDAAIQMGTGVEGAIDKIATAGGKIGGIFKEGIAAGKELADLTVQIEEKENELILTRDRLNRKFAEYNEIAKDTRKTEAERNAAANNAIKVLEEQKNSELELLNLQIRKRELEASANDTSRADQKEINQLIAQRDGLEANFVKRKTELNAVLGGLEKKYTGDVKKETDERIKIQEDYNKKVAKAAQDLTVLRASLIEDETERSLALLQIRFDSEIAAFEGSEEQKTEFLKLKQQERDAAINEIRKANLIKSFEEDQEERKIQIEEAFFNYLISEEERDYQLYEQKKSAAMERLELIREMHGLESAEYQKQALEVSKIEFEQNQKRLDDARRYAEAKKDLERQGLEAVQNVVTGTLTLLGEEEEGRKKNIGAIKAFKAAQMKISWLSELQAIWETANANPTNILFPGAGNIIALAKTFAATARFGKGIKEVMGTKYKFGGPVFGPSHQAGGIPFGVKGSNVRHEMEGNEIILTKGVYENPVLRAAASMINTMAGGRSFAMGGPINPLNKSISPNETPTNIVNNITNNTTQEQSNELVNEVKAMRAELSKWQREFEVKISLQKLREVDEGFQKVLDDVQF